MMFNFLKMMFQPTEIDDVPRYNQNYPYQVTRPTWVVTTVKPRVTFYFASRPGKRWKK